MDLNGEERVLSSELLHYGILRESGRYPWGSGDNPHQRSIDFLGRVDVLRKSGMSDADISRAFGMTTTQLRATTTIARNEKRAADTTMAVRLKDKGLSNVAIGQRMGIPESSVRSILKASESDKEDVLTNTAAFLRDQVNEKGYIDIGVGVENHLGISGTRLKAVTAVLEAEGYSVHTVEVEQVGTGKMTKIKVLAKPDTPWVEIANNTDKIQSIVGYSEDGGRTHIDIQPPMSIDSKRVGIRYAEQGGTDADGVVYVRPGVDDISLGGSRYAQVRVAVDGSHYIKGMAMYKDDLPKGVDLMFNTNKSDTGNKLDALKPLKRDAEGNVDKDLPFGATIKRQITDGNPTDPKLKSVMNIVNEEGNWDEWSKSLSSQMLSKQSTQLAERQLNMTRQQKQQQFDEIMSLTNPSVKRKLLQEFSDDVDSSSVHLKAASLPRQKTQVILPINSLSEHEIYAPNFRNGEKVVLIRYPHGGIFEIPELTVNNNHPAAKKALGQAADAVGINAKVAERLSGADFDGDSVLVIPNHSPTGSRLIQTAPALAGLKNFDPKNRYPYVEGMKVMGAKGGGNTQTEMGKVSNLITDMTIQGANHNELARAVRHSMVVIDAEKHKLNYKQSEIDNNIKELKTKYQGSARSGAATLISRSTSDMRVAERKPRSASEGGAINKQTGELEYVPTGRTYKIRDASGNVVERPRLSKTTKGAEVKNAHSLSSGSDIEKVYADHANSLKSLANQARKAMIETKPVSYSPSAKATYSKEVASLNAKLNTALKNAPLERQAQVLANSTVSAKRKSNPDLDTSELKKIKSKALIDARSRVGAKKTPIDITDSEWDAIQSGAISHSKLDRILANADMDVVKAKALPRTNTVMTSATTARVKAMLAAGHTQSEIADALGIPTSTISSAMLRKG